MTNSLYHKLSVKRSKLGLMTSDGIEVAEFAGQLFFRLWRASHTRTSSLLTGIGLSPPLFALLNIVAAREGPNQQELGSAMGVDPSTMVALIDELERMGLAKRKPHPDDRRAHAVTITPKGRRKLDQARRLAAQVEDEVLHGLTGKERDQLKALLRRALDAAPPQPPWRAEEADQPARRRP